MNLKILLPAALICLAVASCGNYGGKLPLRIYESEDRHSIFYDTEKESGLVLVSSEDWVFTVLLESSTREWIIAERAPALPGKGRIETEHLLFNVSEQLLIDIEAFNNELTSYGMYFADIDGNDFLVAMNIETQEDVFIPVTGLPKEAGNWAAGSGEAGEPFFNADVSINQVSREEDNELPAGELTVQPDEMITLVFELGEDEYHLGQGTMEMWLEGGRLIYAVPSFKVYGGLLYLIDAINFRVMVYDLTGDLLRIVSYPRVNEAGNTNVIRDIAVDDNFMYLLSFYDIAVYIIDILTGDVVTVIDGSDTPAGRFGDIRQVQLDFNGNLILADLFDNNLYHYTVDATSFNLLFAGDYVHAGQLVPAPCGTVYRAETTANGFEVFAGNDSPAIVVECDDPVENAVVDGTCVNENIYVRVVKDAMSQYGDDEVLYVLSPTGDITEIVEVAGWTGGGPMQRNMVITSEGEVFEAYFQNDYFHEEIGITRLSISRIF